MTTTYGAFTTLPTTNLQNLVNDTSDPFTAWQSDRVDNVSSVKADDYEVIVEIPVNATTPANDFAAYVYLVPWVLDGLGWHPGGNFGTVVEPTGVEGTASISEPNSMKGPLMVPLKVASQKLRIWFNVAALCGGVVPDGWSLVVRNCTGAQFTTGSPSECLVAYRALTF